MEAVSSRTPSFVQSAVPKGALLIERVEVVDVATLPAAKVPSWPQPHRICLRVQAESASGDTDRDFYLCSEDPLTDWLMWVKVCQGTCAYRCKIMHFTGVCGYCAWLGGHLS